MSIYSEKVKKDLVQKIDTYFKDKDYGYSEIYSLIKYVEDDLGYNISLELDQILSTQIDLIAEEEFDSFKKSNWELENNFIKTCIPTISKKYKDVFISHIRSKIEIVSKSLGSLTFKDRHDICLNCLNELRDQSLFEKLVLSYGTGALIPVQGAEGVIDGLYSSRNQAVLGSSIFEKGKKEFIKVFYKNIILPICDYIISNFDEIHLIKTLLERYKFRTEHYTKNDLQKKLIDELKPEEKVFQPDLALYLLDQGFFKFTKESHTVNSNRIDFLGDDFIIEVKQIDLAKTLKFSGTCQLLSYLNNENKKTGFLVIYINGKCNDSEKTIFNLVNELITFLEKKIYVFLIDSRFRNASNVIANEVDTASKIKSVTNIDIKIDPLTLEIKLEEKSEEPSQA